MEEVENVAMFNFPGILTCKKVSQWLNLKLSDTTALTASSLLIGS